MGNTFDETRGGLENISDLVWQILEMRDILTVEKLTDVNNHLAKLLACEERALEFMVQYESWRREQHVIAQGLLKELAKTVT